MSLRKLSVISLAVILVAALIFVPVSYSSTANASTNSSQVLHGIRLEFWPSAEKQSIEKYQEMTNNTFSIFHSFVNTNQDLSTWEDFMNYVHDNNSINLLTLIFEKPDESGYNTAEINNGALDGYFANLANQLKSWQNGSDVWIRIMHEVNGNWTSWGVGDSTVNTNDSYKKAFQRVVTIFRDNGASNVKFIYNVNYESVGKNATFMGAYPGDEYVDYVSTDGFNWGTTKTWSKWKSFSELFDPSYKALAAGSSKPIIIVEYSSTEKGGDKAVWITDVKNQINSGKYPRLAAAVWFNANEEIDWRIESSASSLQAYSNINK